MQNCDRKNTKQQNLLSLTKQLKRVTFFSLSGSTSEADENANGFMDAVDAFNTSESIGIMDARTTRQEKLPSRLLRTGTDELCHLLHGKMKSVMYVACLCVCLSVCVSVCVSVCLCIIKQICPLASVASFGDIAIFFSEQLGLVALRR